MGSKHGKNRGQKSCDTLPLIKGRNKINSFIHPDRENFLTLF